MNQIFCIKHTCLGIKRACLILSSITDLHSSMDASISVPESGYMASSNTVLVTGVLDMAEILDGFAQRLRELRKQFQEVERLPDEDKHVVKKLLDAFLTKKHLQALAR